MKIFLRLVSYSFRYKKKFLLGIFAGFLTSILNVLILSFLIPIFDSFEQDKKMHIQFKLTNENFKIIMKERFFGNDSLDGLEKVKRKLIYVKLWFNDFFSDKNPFKVVSILFLIYFAKIVAYLISIYCIATAGFKAIHQIRKELFKKIFSLPLTHFYKEKTGILMSKIVKDVEMITPIISNNLRDAIINIFYIFSHLIVLFYLNVELLIIACFAIPFVIFPVTAFTNKIGKSTKRYQEKVADLNSNLQEMIGGIRLIRLLGTERLERKKFQSINEKVYKSVLKGEYYLQIAPGIVELTSSLLVLSFFALGSVFIEKGQFTQGEFMAFLLTLVFLLRPVTQISQMLGKISQAKISGSRIFETLDFKEKDKIEITNFVPNFKIQKSIEFKNISFSYKNTQEPVLNDFNLKLNVGETVAFVGKSGSGKSTLMDLVLRFFEPTKGGIFFDGVNIKNLKLDTLRKKIGIVTQDIFLFHGTIADNISYGKENINFKDIEKSSRLANANDFIQQTKHSYNTVLGTKGLNLSGGQRQKLVMARAFLRDPEILILDEASSSLDVKSEKIINKTLNRLFKNRTTFIIAHRFSTIRRIPKIAVVNKGKIVEIGNHEELIALNGYYKKLNDSEL